MQLQKFLLCAVLVSLSVAAEPTIPLEEFAKLPYFSRPVPSPNGDYVAFYFNIEGKIEIVIKKQFGNIDAENNVPIRIGFSEKFHPHRFTWASDERLIVSGRATTSVNGDLRNLTRLASFSRDGTDSVPFKPEANDFGYYMPNPRIVSTLKHDPDHILVEMENEPTGWGEPRVHEVNIHTGKKKLVLKNRKKAFYWLADERGAVRIGTKYVADRGRSAVTIFYREDPDSDWETLQKVDYFDHDRLIPYRFDKEDPNILLVTTQEFSSDAHVNETEENTIFRYDLAKRKIAGEYINLHYREMKEFVESTHPGREVDIISIDRAEQIFYFRIYSDVHAPEYHVLNLNTKTLDFIAAEHPELVSNQLAPMSKVTYSAEDGMDIPAFVTLPLNAENKPIPFVVYPHGGPWAHDEWGYDNYVQFFASMGYGVFQPQFRGSTGYGIEHEEAGYGEWGYAIQDDITAGVQWLIDEGIADPGNICIVGSSFGGYAAAMGLAKSPDQFKCGISINGVMDLKELLYENKKSLFEGINRRVSNSPAEAHDASPFHISDQISAPLLLIGSERDTVVPVKHSKRMLKKLKKNKQSVEYVELPDGEHWRTIERNELIKFKAMRDFLNQHLDAP